LAIRAFLRFRFSVDAGRAVSADDLAVGVFADDFVDDEVLGDDHVAFHADHLGDVVMRREPSRSRAAWTITSTDPVIISRMVFAGSESRPWRSSIPYG
jgi:hypothetical protein